MADYIYIKDLVVEGKHGVHPPEKENAQSFSISVKLFFDTSKARLTDELEDTMNWSALRKTIIEIVQSTSFNLIERLADEIAQTILKDKRIQKIAVSIDKLEAFSSGIPGVSIELTNSN